MHVLLLFFVRAGEIPVRHVRQEHRRQGHVREAVCLPALHQGILLGAFVIYQKRPGERGGLPIHGPYDQHDRAAGIGRHLDPGRTPGAEDGFGQCLSLGNIVSVYIGIGHPPGIILTDNRCMRFSAILGLQTGDDGFVGLEGSRHQDAVSVQDGVVMRQQGPFPGIGGLIRQLTGRKCTEPGISLAGAQIDDQGQTARESASESP